MILFMTVLLAYPAFEYTVQPDDTLNFIAFSHNTTVEEILRLNPQIGNRDLVWLGQKIKLK